MYMFQLIYPTITHYPTTRDLLYYLVNSTFPSYSDHPRKTNPTKLTAPANTPTTHRT